MKLFQTRFDIFKTCIELFDYFKVIHFNYITKYIYNFRNINRYFSLNKFLSTVDSNIIKLYLNTLYKC